MSFIKTEPVRRPSAAGRPSLALTTPVTANFPREAMSAASELQSALSEKTPLSAVSVSSCFREALTSGGLPSAGLPSAGLHSTTLSPYPGNGSAGARIKAEEVKTPITPPMAYTDFLRSMTLASPSLASPPLTGKTPLNRTSTTGSLESTSSVETNTTSASDASDDTLDKGEESMPSTAASEVTDVSCHCEYRHKTPKGKGASIRSPRPAAINTQIPASPFGSKHPLSAPATGPTSTGFASLGVPASPSVTATGLDTPLSARSPWSARSVQSPFDWDSALKGRRFTEVLGVKAGPATATGTTSAASPVSFPTGVKRDSRSTIRHIREVVTRTVTYTPRMGPAPKGKRRKMNHGTAVES